MTFKGYSGVNGEDLLHIDALTSYRPPAPFEQAFAGCEPGTPREVAQQAYDDFLDYHHPRAKTEPEMTPEQFDGAWDLAEQFERDLASLSSETSPRTITLPPGSDPEDLFGMPPWAHQDEEEVRATEVVDDVLHLVHLRCQIDAPIKVTWCKAAVEDSGQREVAEGAGPGKPICERCLAARSCGACGMPLEDMEDDE